MVYVGTDFPGNQLWAIRVDGRVYFSGGDGKTTVIRAGRKFEKLAENQLSGRVVASPAIAGHAVFLRTDSHLYRIEKKKPADD